MSLYYRLERIYAGRRAGADDRPMAGERSCRVSREGRAYVVRLHGNAIIVAYPDHTMVNNCGWRTNLTHDRLHSIAGVRMGRNSRCPYDNKYRIFDPVRGIDLPMDLSVRIDLNGRVFDEYVQPDFKTRVVPRVSAQYNGLCRRAWAKISARVEVGEFMGESTPAWQTDNTRLRALERIAEQEFPAHEDVVLVFSCKRSGVSEENWASIVNELRMAYYVAYRRYVTEKIPRI